MGKLAAALKKRPLNGILILGVLVLYFANNLLFKSVTEGALQYFMVCHFNDLICPLLFLSYCNLLLLTRSLELTKFWQLMALCAASALAWEFLGPVVKPGSVTDLWDLVCYMAGGILYWLALKCAVRRKP